MDELNLSWCFDFTEKHVQMAVAHVSETITQLNLSGYRKNLQKSGKIYGPSAPPPQQQLWVRHKPLLAPLTPLPETPSFQLSN